jgi:Tfp pilus assembly protein PilF
LGKKQFDRALADYHKALALDPNYTVTYCNLVQLYVEKDDLSEACKWLERYAKFGNVDYEFLKHDKAFDRFRNTTCYKNIVLDK